MLGEPDWGSFGLTFPSILCRTNPLPRHGPCCHAANRVRVVELILTSMNDEARTRYKFLLLCISYHVTSPVVMLKIVPSIISSSAAAGASGWIIAPFQPTLELCQTSSARASASSARHFLPWTRRRQICSTFHFCRVQLHTCRSLPCTPPEPAGCSMTCAHL
jgi:hypothetical protein